MAGPPGLEPGTSGSADHQETCYTFADLSSQAEQPQQQDIYNPRPAEDVAMTITREMVRKAIERAVLEAYWAMQEQAKRPTEARETQRPEYVIEWNEDIKAKFVEWLKARGRDEEYITDLVRYLDKYMRPIRRPIDIVSMFAECRRGKAHLSVALRNLLNFYRKIMGFPKDFIEDLKEAIPTVKKGQDTYVPSEEAVIATLKALRHAPFKYYLYWWVPLATGIRVKKDAIRLITEADLSRAERIETPHGAYYFLELGWIRETKATFVACLPDFIYDMIIRFRESGEKLTYNGARQFRKKRMPHIEAPNSMRDFCYNKLLELGMPESAADFLNGRGPRRIGGKHYMDKIRQIKAFYPRYLAYLKELKAKVEQD